MRGPEPASEFCFLRWGPDDDRLAWKGPAAVLLAGEPPSRLADLPAVAIPGDAAGIVADIEALRRGGSISRRFRARNGSHWLILQAAADAAGGEAWIGRDAEGSAEADLRRSLVERETLLKELHHRVKNNLQLIVSLISLKTSTVDDPQRQADLEDVLGKVHAVALVQKKIYESATLVEMRLDEYVAELAQSIGRASGRKGVELDLRLSPVAVPIARAVPVGLIVHELLTAAVGGTPTDEPCLVSAILEAADGRATLSIRQSGATVPAVPSFARQLMTALARQVGGEISFDPERGRDATLQFGLQV